MESELNELNALKKIRNLLGGALAAGALLFTLSCSGNTNTTGPAPPLSTGQPGSLSLYSSANNGCYVLSDGSPCPTSPPPKGKYPVTALGTEYISATASYLLVGDAGGNVYGWTTNGLTAPSSSSVQCGGGSGHRIDGIAAYESSGTVNVYFASGGMLYVNSGSSQPCSTSSSTTSTTIAGTSRVVGLALSGSTIYGVTQSGQYFFVPGTTPTSSPPVQPLPGLLSGASIGGIASDTNGIVFATDQANSAIYAFYPNSSGTLTNIGTFTGNADISNPGAITTSVVSGIPSSVSYCSPGTAGTCEFLYVTNYSGAIAQFSLSIGGSPPSSVGYNEFNAPYFQCEIINPIAMTSFPDFGNETGLGANGHASVPYVFLGQNGTTTGQCFGTSSSTYGNGVTAYIPYGE